ncbi:MAG: NAD(P)-binding domain-containing protein [Burkholderiales bacterium]|nr:NAD(P)-binding domain-containing protein [Burkholderiales bacterium]
MKIAVIGAGVVGAALARAWQQKGHDIRFGARDTASAKVSAAVAAIPGARAAAIADAVAWGDLAVLATPWGGTEAALKAAGSFGGKALLDATNPLTPTYGLALGHSTSGGEQVQAWATDAKVVKIFNTTGFDNMADTRYAQGRPAMIYCGDDAAAKAAAAALAADLGFEPIDLGRLDGARYLEPYAMVWIKLALAQGLGRNIAFALMRR